MSTISKELLIKYVNDGKTIRSIANECNMSYTTIRYWLKKYNLKTKASKTKWSKKEMLNAIKTSETKADVLRKLNLMIRPGNYATLDRFIKQHNVDVSHMKGNKAPRGGTKKRLKNVMVKNSTYARGCLKRQLLKEEIIEYKCAKCEIDPQWNGETLTLRLDHINGVNNDNRLENLRFLCPNCDSQEETFARTNKSLKKRKETKFRQAAIQSGGIDYLRNPFAMYKYMTEDKRKKRNRINIEKAKKLGLNTSCFKIVENGKFCKIKCI